MINTPIPVVSRPKFAVRSGRKTSRGLVIALILTLIAGLTAACDGQATSPGSVAGLPITHFPSGLKDGAPKPTIPVRNVSDSEADRIAVTALADLTVFWADHMPKYFDGQVFQPVNYLLSYDAKGENQQNECVDTRGKVNAFYCTLDDSIAWDRGTLLPLLLDRFGPMAVVSVLAHEYGHAIQHRLGDKAGINDDTPTIVAEQQADCFDGAYLRWIAEDKSKYYQVSTAEGLGQVLASLHLIRDEAGHSATSSKAHGSGFDRIYAFQRGFEKGVQDCATINLQDVQSRLTEVPFDPNDLNKGDTRIDKKSMGQVQQSLDQAFASTGAQPPRIVDEGGYCVDGPVTPPASYCPNTNTVSINLPALADLGRPTDQESELVGSNLGGFGDFAAFSEIASRYVQGVQKAVGTPLDDANAGLRTACLVGTWAKMTSQPGNIFRLSPGDLDEAISDLLLPTSLVAADVNGKRVQSGFARVAALRDGFLGGAEACTSQFAAAA